MGIISGLMRNKKSLLSYLPYVLSIALILVFIIIYIAFTGLPINPTVLLNDNIDSTQYTFKDYDTSKYSYSDVFGHQYAFKSTYTEAYSIPSTVYVDHDSNTKYFQLTNARTSILTTENYSSMRTFNTLHNPYKIQERTETLGIMKNIGINDETIYRTPKERIRLVPYDDGYHGTDFIRGKEGYNYRALGVEEYYNRTVMKYKVFREPNISDILSGNLSVSGFSEDRDDFNIYVDTETKLVLKYENSDFRDGQNITNMIFPVDQEPDFSKLRVDVEKSVKNSNRTFSNFNIRYNNSMKVAKINILESFPKNSNEPIRLSLNTNKGTYSKVLKVLGREDVYIYVDNSELKVARESYELNDKYSDINGSKITARGQITNHTYINTTISNNVSVRPDVPVNLVLYDGENFTQISGGRPLYKFSAFSWYYNGRKIPEDTNMLETEMFGSLDYRVRDYNSKNISNTYRGLNVNDTVEGEQNNTIELRYDVPAFGRYSVIDRVIKQDRNNSGRNRTVVRYNVTESGLTRTYTHESFRIIGEKDIRTCFNSKLAGKRNCEQLFDGKVDSVKNIRFNP